MLSKCIIFTRLRTRRNLIICDKATGRTNAASIIDPQDIRSIPKSPIACSTIDSCRKKNKCQRTRFYVLRFGPTTSLCISPNAKVCLHIAFSANDRWRRAWNRSVTSKHIPEQSCTWGICSQDSQWLTIAHQVKRFMVRNTIGYLWKRRLSESASGMIITTSSSTPYCSLGGTHVTQLLSSEMSRIGANGTDCVYLCERIVPWVNYGV